MKDERSWLLDDPGKLKALAHPMRRRMLRHLAAHGPATSTTLGELLAAKTGTTSYHLRQLEKYGFVEEIPERSTGRERWWRRVETGDIRLPTPGQLAPEDRPVLEAFHRIGLEEDLRLLEGLPAVYRADPEWVQVSRGGAHLNKAELRAFFEDYMQVLMKHSRTASEASPDARHVLIRLFAVPDDEE